MNKWVLIGVLLLSIMGAVVNNLVTKEPVKWIGSPRVLEKPGEF